MSSNEANRHEGAITIYGEVASHLVTRYATDFIIGKADKEIRNFKQGLLTP